MLFEGCLIEKKNFFLIFNRTCKCKQIKILILPFLAKQSELIKATKRCKSRFKNFKNPKVVFGVVFYSSKKNRLNKK